MPTYIQKDTASDISPSWPNATQFDVDMSAGTGGTGGNNISLNASEIKSASFITVANKPNSDAFEDGGTQTVEVSPSSAAMTIRIRCRMARLSSTGVILGVKGAFTGFQIVTAGDMTFSPVSPTWTGTELCSDRLAVEWEFENTDTMMSASVILESGDVTEEVITDITENGGTCPAPIIQTIQAIWNVQKAIVGSCQKIWDVLVTAGGIQQTVQAIWNVDKAIVGSCQKIWNVKNKILQTCQKIWNVQFAHSHTIQVIWNAQKAILQTCQKIWDVKSLVIQACQKIWNVKKLVLQTCQKIWNIRNVILQTCQKIWAVLAIAGVTYTVQIIWNVQTYI